MRRKCGRAPTLRPVTLTACLTTSASAGVPMPRAGPEPPGSAGGAHHRGGELRGYFLDRPLRGLTEEGLAKVLAAHVDRAEVPADGTAEQQALAAGFTFPFDAREDFAGRGVDHPY